MLKRGGPLSQNDYIKISKSKTYQKLTQSRTKYSWMMTFLILIVYFGFIYLVAFHKEFLSQKFNDSVITYSIPVGIGVILFTIVITGIYVRRANTEFDSLTSKIKSEIQ
jgi:uncharacterized membrane protein (DUF485 family)